MINLLNIVDDKSWEYVLPAEFGRVFGTNFLQFFAQTIVFQTEVFHSLFIFLLFSVIDVIKKC